jgi:hypothetical protein
MLNVLTRDPKPVERQISDFFGTAKAKGAGQVPFSTKTLSAKFDSSAKRESLLWGPFMLNPANVCWTFHHQRFTVDNSLKVE